MPIKTRNPIIFCFLLFILIVLTPLPGAANDVFIVNGRIAAGPDHQAGDDFKQIADYNEWYNWYINPADGYRLLYPRYMVTDVSLAAVRSVFADTNTQIEVYYDNFSGTATNADTYIAYANRFAGRTANCEREADRTLTVNGLDVHLLKWTRPKLSRLPGDKNHYLSAEIIKNQYEVYTIFIKSQEPISNEMDIIGSFQFIDRQGTPRNRITARPAINRLNRETAALYDRYFLAANSLTWGIFEPSAPEALSYLTELEEKLDYFFPFVIRYQTLDEYLPRRGLENAYANNRYVELTLQTFFTGQQDPAGNHPDNDLVIYDILDGKYDDYFNTYAQNLKEFGHPVLFRLNNEMNGDWCRYSSYYTGKDTDLYKALWRYLRTIFAANGADNVIWVWNPHDLSRPDFKWNNYLLYYPGDEWVEVVGLTGYNTGTYFPGEKWREFTDIYRPLYSEYQNSFAKPFMITEFGANSAGGDKIAWLDRMFNHLNEFPNIKVAIWWNGVDYDKNGQPARIYRLDETEATIAAFRQHLKAFRPPDNNLSN